MGISESIIKRSLECCENICEDIDCEIDSGCCKTHYSNNSPSKRNNSKDSVKSDQDSEDE